MKRLGARTRVDILNRVSSYFRRPISTTRSNKGLFRSRSLMAVIAPVVLVLLAGVSLFPTIRGAYAPGSVIAFAENIATFSPTDCTTPQTTWNQGQEVCAVDTGTIVERHITWIAPDGSVARVSDPPFTG